MKLLKVKDIVPYLFWFSDIKMYQGDVKIDLSRNDADNWEEVYCGSVLNIPWIYMDYYLTNTADGEALGIEYEKDNPKNQYFVLSICEDKEIAIKYAKGEL